MNRTVAIAIAVVAAAAIAGGIYLKPRFESDKPTIQLAPDSDAFGAGPVEITVADAGTGLKSIVVTLSAGGAEMPVAAERLAQPAKERKLSIALGKVAGVKEGPATLKIVAHDAALFRGNEAVVTKQITIDLTPPTIDLVADDRYINFGGAGALVYTASPDTATSGVRVGQHFFPGFPGQVKDHPERLFVLFAHPYDSPPGTKAVLVATDKAGNTREMPISYELKNVQYKKSTIALTDNFLQNKVAPLAPAEARQLPPNELFVVVNKTLRKANEAKIAEVTGKATPKMLWNGAAFTQLSNSKVEANFADFRTYTLNGQPVDSAYHLGYDLSVTKRYPVEAANAGSIAFAGDLGIYGNCVMIDHGLGLYTLYGHLSQIDVKVGDSVQGKQVIGKSGETGLAAGDHLHFGVYLAGVAVLPVEWWDAKWINDNITPKLAGGTGEEIAKEQAPKKARAKGSAAPKKKKRRR